MCAVFGNVVDSAKLSSEFEAGTATVIDMYVENTTSYPNWVRRARACPARASASEARIA